MEKKLHLGREQKQTAYFLIQKGLSDILPFLLEHTGERRFTSVTT